MLTAAQFCAKVRWNCPTKTSSVPADPLPSLGAETRCFSCGPSQFWEKSNLLFPSNRCQWNSHSDGCVGTRSGTNCRQSTCSIQPAPACFIGLYHSGVTHQHFPMHLLMSVVVVLVVVVVHVTMVSFFWSADHHREFRWLQKRRNLGSVGSVSDRYYFELCFPSRWNLGLVVDINCYQAQEQIHDRYIQVSAGPGKRVLSARVCVVRWWDLLQDF